MPEIKNDMLLIILIIQTVSVNSNQDKSQENSIYFIAVSEADLLAILF